MIYGLVAPGYDMAEVVTNNLMGGDAEFQEADMSTKLKLMGVDVASFGDAEVKVTPFLSHTNINACAVTCASAIGRKFTSV